MSDAAASTDGGRGPGPTRAWERWLEGGRLLSPLGLGGFRRAWSESQRRRKIIQLARNPHWLRENLPHLTPRDRDDLRAYWDLFAENLAQPRAFAEELGEELEGFARVLGAGAEGFARGLLDPADWALGIDAKAWARGLGPNSGDWARGLGRRIEPYTRALGSGNTDFCQELGPHSKSYIRALGPRVEDWARGLGPVASELPVRVWSPFELGDALQGWAASFARGLGRHAPAFTRGLGGSAFAFFLGLEGQAGAGAAFFDACGERAGEAAVELGEAAIALHAFIGEDGGPLASAAAAVRGSAGFDEEACFGDFGGGLGGLAGPLGRIVAREPARFFGRVGAGLEAFARGLDEGATSRLAVGLREQAWAVGQALAPSAEAWTRGLGPGVGVFFQGFRAQAASLADGLGASGPRLVAAVEDPAIFAGALAEASGPLARGFRERAEELGRALGASGPAFHRGLGERLQDWVRGLGPGFGAFLNGLGEQRRAVLESCLDRASAFGDGLRHGVGGGLPALGDSAAVLAEVFAGDIEALLTGLKEDRGAFFAVLGEALPAFLGGLGAQGRLRFAAFCREDALILGLTAGLDAEAFAEAIRDGAEDFMDALGPQVTEFREGLGEAEARLSAPLTGAVGERLAVAGSQGRVSRMALIETVRRHPKPVGRALRPRAAQLGRVFRGGMRGFRGSAGASFFEFLAALGGEAGAMFAAMSDRELEACVYGLSDRARDLGAALAGEAEAFARGLGSKVELFFRGLNRSVSELTRGIGDQAEAFGRGLSEHTAAAAAGLRGNAFHFAHGFSEHCVGFERGLGEEALLAFRRGLGEGGTDYWLVASSRARRQRSRRGGRPRIQILGGKERGEALRLDQGGAQVFKVLKVKHGSPVRCVLCHCEAIDNEDFLRCAACRILAHEDCLFELAENRCPNDATPGQRFAAVRVQYQQERRLKIQATERQRSAAVQEPSAGD